MKQEESPRPLKRNEEVAALKEGWGGCRLCVVRVRTDVSRAGEM